MLPISAIQSSSYAYNPSSRHNSSAEESSERDAGKRPIEAAAVSASTAEHSSFSASAEIGGLNKTVNGGAEAHATRGSAAPATRASSSQSTNVQTNAASGEPEVAEAQLRAAAPPVDGFANQSDLFSALFDLGVINSADWGSSPGAPNEGKNALAELYASSKLGDEAPQSIERKA